MWTERLLGGQKRGDATPYYVMLTCDPIGLWTGIHLGNKLHMHVWEGSRVGQVWKKNKWPRVKRPGRNVLYKWLNCLFTELLLTSGEAYNLSLQVYLPCFCLNKLFLSPMCALLCVALCMSLIINFVPAFIVFACMRNAFSLGQKPRKNSF